jgi:hypothetical protein
MSPVRSELTPSAFRIASDCIGFLLSFLIFLLGLDFLDDRAVIACDIFGLGGVAAFFNDECIALGRVTRSQINRRLLPSICSHFQTIKDLAEFISRQSDCYFCAHDSAIPGQDSKRWQINLTEKFPRRGAKARRDETKKRRTKHQKPKPPVAPIFQISAFQHVRFSAFSQNAHLDTPSGASQTRRISRSTELKIRWLKSARH